MANLPPPMPSRRTAPQDNGLSVASLVLGIASIPTAPCLVGGVIAIVGLITGIFGITGRKTGRPMAIIGIALSITGLVCTVLAVIMWYQAVPLIREQFASFENMTKGDHSQWVGVNAPDIEMETLDGKKIKLSELRGKRVIIDVFTTWDPDCETQIARLNELRAELGESDVAIFGISYDLIDDIRDFSTEVDAKYPLTHVEVMAMPYDDVLWFPTTFYIDRNGVIDAFSIDHQIIDDLRKFAAAPDYTGEVLDEPRAPQSQLTIPENPMTMAEVWRTKIPNVQAMCTGDWDADGTPNILIVDDHPELHILDAAGGVIKKVPLPEEFASVTFIEFGRHKELGARLLGLSSWGTGVYVADKDGKLAWDYPVSTGINGAHWGDLNGDGSDELVVGINGFGGVHALDPNGDALWKVRSITNVWNHAVIAMADGQPARVIATEAGGRIYIFDEDGNKLNTIQPLGNYYADLNAARVDTNGRIQILASGDGMRSNVIVACDEAGVVAWNVPNVRSIQDWTEETVASGDVDGDGVAEWVFHDTTGKLLAVTPDGEQRAAYRSARNTDLTDVLGGTDATTPLILLLQDDELAGCKLVPEERETEDQSSTSDESKDAATQSVTEAPANEIQPTE